MKRQLKSDKIVINRDKESDDRFRNLIENINEVIFEIDENGIIRYIGPSIGKLLGYSPEEIIGNNFMLYVGENASILAERLSLIQNEPDIENDYLFPIKTGEKRWIHLSSHAIHEDGVFRGASGTMADITDRKRTELQRDRQHRYIKSLNEIAEVILTNDKADEILTNANRIIGEMLQLDRALIYEVSFRENKIFCLCEWLQEETITSIFTKGEYPMTFVPRSFVYLHTSRQYLESQYNNPNELLSSDESADLLHHQMKIKSLLWFPFSFYKDKFYFFSLNQILEQRNWTTEDIGFLESVGKHISLALVKIKLLEDQVNSQRELEHSEERFRQIVEQSNGVVWEVDQEGLYTYVSPVAERIYGQKPELLIGKMHFYDLHPEELRLELIEQSFAVFARKERFADFLNSIIHPDGHEVILSTNGIPLLDKNNNLLGYRGVDIDVTEKINSENELRKFRTISDQANYGSAIADLNGNLIYVNDSFAKMHGMESDELVGKSLLITHNEEQMIQVRKLLNVIADKGGFTAEEVWHTRKDGTTFPSLMSTSTVYDDSQNPIFLSSTTIDITEKKEAEEKLKEQTANLAKVNLELERANEELIVLDKAKLDFLKLISHEIRTPLNGIMGFTDILKAEIQSPELLEYLQYMEESAKRLEKFSYQAMLITEMISGFYQLKLTDVQIPELLINVRLIHEHAINSKKIHLKTENFQDLKTIFCDEKLLQVCFNGLIDNAIKVSREDEIVLVKIYTNEKSTICEFIDFGPGFSSEVIKGYSQLFGLADKHFDKNTGLGLYMVKLITDLHKGQIQLINNMRGATVRLSFPLKA